MLWGVSQKWLGFSGVPGPDRTPRLAVTLHEALERALVGFDWLTGMIK